MKQTKGSKALLTVLREFPDYRNHGFGIDLTEDDIKLLNSTIRKRKIPADAFVAIDDRKPVLKWYEDGYECQVDNLDRYFPAETLTKIAERIRCKRF